MRGGLKIFALSSLLVLAACAVSPPTGPSVMALPNQGKSFEIFMQEDFSCRQYASGITGFASPSQAGTIALGGSAALGTALGAGVGAAAGSVAGALGTGAAIGGAMGLLAGSAIGASNAQNAGGNLQQRYDTAYTQCMYARGNSVQPLPGIYPYGAYAYGYPYYPYWPAYYWGPAYYGPSIGIGFFGGWGWGGNLGHWHGGGWHGGGWHGGGWHGGHR